jgi:hypothetical protein
MRIAALVTALIVGLAQGACSSSSSEDPKPAADAGADDAARDGAKLPNCVGEGGYQCQPKGCLSGFMELGGYDCGNSGGSCCAKEISSSDSGVDSAADAKND